MGRREVDVRIVNLTLICNCSTLVGGLTISLRGKLMPKRVLVVEGSWLVRRMVADTMLAAGHDVEVAEDGLQACSRLEGGEEFDLVISGRRMPGMDGIELLQRMRRSVPTVGIAFILMSGGGTVVSDKDQTSLKELCGALNASFLEKPFLPSDLLALLEEKEQVGVAPDFMDY